MADRDSIAIIIVTFNSVEEIDACLDSLVGHTEPFPTTITIVDNASSDGTATHVRERWPSVRVIRTLKRIEGEGRLATPEEKSELVKYTGWGAMPAAFERQPSRDWKVIADELREILTPDEYASARGSRQASLAGPE